MSKTIKQWLDEDFEGKSEFVIHQAITNCAEFLESLFTLADTDEIIRLSEYIRDETHDANNIMFRIKIVSMLGQFIQRQEVDMDDERYGGMSIINYMGDFFAKMIAININEGCFGELPRVKITQKARSNKKRRD